MIILSDIDDVPGETIDDITPMCTFHKSILDQLTLVKQRNMDIDQKIISPFSKTDEFITKMEELSFVRGNMLCTDSVNNPEEVYQDLLTLKGEIDNMILGRKIDIRDNDNIRRLLSTAYIPIKRNKNKQEVEFDPKEFTIALIVTTVILGVGTFVFNLIFGSE